MKRTGVRGDRGHKKQNKTNQNGQRSAENSELSCFSCFLNNTAASGATRNDSNPSLLKFNLLDTSELKLKGDK